MQQWWRERERREKKTDKSHDIHIISKSGLDVSREIDSLVGENLAELAVQQCVEVFAVV